MISPHSRFAKSPDLVLRRLPEWRQCYAYTPAQPELVELNATAWLIVELCDGQPLDALERDFAEIARQASPEACRDLLHGAITDLVGRGILIEAHPTAAPISREDEA